MEKSNMPTKFYGNHTTTKRLWIYHKTVIDFSGVKHNVDIHQTFLLINNFYF